MPNNNETTTKFKVDISELKSAMQEAKRQVQVANSEFKAVSSSMDNWSKSTDGIKAKLKQLDSNLKSQKTVLSSLEKQYELTVAQMGEGSAEADRLKIAINNQKAVVNGTERQMREYENSLEEVAEAEKKAEKHGTSVEEELENLEKQTKKTGDGFTVFKGVLANLATQGINLALDGIKSLGGAMVNMVKESVSAYADYEQLVGGVDTLFKDSSKIVQNYANNAYKTAGMSANEYMETVTSFSASLLSALGGDTKKSAEVANMAITDMSDNANKMGTSMEMIQNAYNGFAKSNFTMLDNLKLGYGGTQEEMKRLLSDAEALSGQKYDISNLNDVFQAIHVIQTELGITGTTAKEASTTISGSIDSLKSAWQNFLAGVANGDSNISQLTSNLVDGLKTVLSNLAPVVKSAVSNLVDVAKKELPPALKKLYEAFKSLLPPELQEALGKVETALKWIIDNKDTLIASLVGIGTGFAVFKIVGVITSLITAVKNLGTAMTVLKAIMTALGGPVTIVITVISALVAGFIYLWNTSDGFRNFWINLWENIKSVTSTAINAIVNFFTVTIPNAFNTVVTAISNFITSAGESIKNFFTVTIPSAIQTAVDWFLDLPNKIAYALGYALGTLIQWGVDLFNFVTTTIPQVIESIVTFFSQLPSKIWTWLLTTLTNIANWVAEMKTKAIDAGKSFVDNAITYIKELPTKIWTWLTNVITKITTFANNLKSKAKEAGTNFTKTLVDNVKELPDKFKEIGGNIVTGIWDGISAGWEWLTGKVKDLANSLLEGAKDALGIASPSKAFRDEVGKWIPAGISVGVDKNAKTALASVKNLSMDMLSSARDGLNSNSDITGGVVNNFTQVINSPKQLSRLEIYRQSKNLLGYAGGGM